MDRKAFAKNIMGKSLFLPNLQISKGITVNPVINDRLTIDDYGADTILILIQLFGGNDGLNSVVPIESYDNLAAHRSNILIKPNKLISVDNHVALHPSLSKFSDLIQQKYLSVVHNVGYPDPNRSHFRSMDIWNSASPSNSFWSSGWIGRYLDAAHSNYPSGYPNKFFPHPLAIAVGNMVADSCQGKECNYSYAISDVSSLYSLKEHPLPPYEEKSIIDELSFLNETLLLTNQYMPAIISANKKGNNNFNYPETLFANQLKTVARLICGGLKTRIYTLSLGGFDTHAYQTTQDDSTIGSHAELLRTLSGGIYAFQKDITSLGLEEKVLGITYSEFGRQIKSNASFGTDHGDAAPLFIFGKNIYQSFVGHTPVIPKEVDEQAAIKMEFDFRDIYGSITNQWLKMPASSISSIFEKKFSSTLLVKN